MSAMAFLVIYVVCTIGLNSSMTFYDAMLPDITTDERMDAVSSSGYAWGYIGSTIPFIICLALIMAGPSALGLETMFCTRTAFIITGVWWLVFTLPLLRTYKQKYGRERSSEDTLGHIVSGVFSEVAHTMKEIARDKVAPVHGGVLLLHRWRAYCHLHGYELRLFVGHRLHAARLGFARHAIRCIPLGHHLRQARRPRGHSAHDYRGCGRLYVHRFVCRVLPQDRYRVLDPRHPCGYVPGRRAGAFAQLLCKIIPKEKSNEYYGFFDIFGRYASVMGTLLVSVVTSLTGDPSLGVLSIGILLVVGFVLLVKLSKMQGSAA